MAETKEAVALELARLIAENSGKVGSEKFAEKTFLKLYRDCLGIVNGGFLPE